MRRRCGAGAAHQQPAARPFDRVEVRRAGLPVEQGCADPLHGGGHPAWLAGGQVVDRRHGARLQRRRQRLFDMGVDHRIECFDPCRSAIATASLGGSRAWVVPRPQPAHRGRNTDPEARRRGSGTRDAHQAACKPGSVPPVARDRRPFLWDGGCPPPRATYPDGARKAPAGLRRRPSLSGLAPGGVCPAAAVASGAVRSCRTVSPLPRVVARARRFVFCGTFPGVAPAGRYPAPFFRGARTFLGGVAPAAAVQPPGARCMRLSCGGNQSAPALWPDRAFHQRGHARRRPAGARIGHAIHPMLHPVPLERGDQLR